MCSAQSRSTAKTACSSNHHPRRITAPAAFCRGRMRALRLLRLLRQVEPAPARRFRPEVHALVSRVAVALGEVMHAFTEWGIDGFGMRPVLGRPRRLSEAERSAVIASSNSTELFSRLLQTALVANRIVECLPKLSGGQPNCNGTQGTIIAASLESYGAPCGRRGHRLQAST